MLTWEVVGAVVGAGFASGREIATYFAPYGLWGYAGIVAAVCFMMYLADGRIEQTSYKGLRICWHIGIHVLLIVTGGAMLSAAGELSSMMLPFHYGGITGAVLTFVIAWWLAKHSSVGLSCISKMLVVVMLVNIAAGLWLPTEQGMVVEIHRGEMAAIKWLAYGGYNAALLVPVCAYHVDIPRRQRNVEKGRASIIIACLLSMGNLVLNLHHELTSETLPFVRLSSRFGIAGFIMASGSMYLAVLSTLTACIRGLPSGWLSLCIIAVSIVGFKETVAYVYPIVGFTCMVLLVISKCVNYASDSFQSSSDVL
ncbi:MAG: hypothetical protein IKL25_10580 [Clostridia bacterium]|nr:hypothetical protein [Clostridia bacterium]